jgi:hypothetical protein
MLSGYVRTGYAHYDTLILKRATDSTKIDLRLPVVNPVWFGAIPGDGLSDRQAIQSAIDYAVANRGSVKFPPGVYDIDTSVVLSSFTTIDARGAQIRLMNSSDCPMATNANKSTSGDLVIEDSLITIIGGYWEGNGDNQIKLMADGTPVTGFLFSGVKRLYMSDLVIHNTQTYAIGCSNVTYPVIERIKIDQGPLPAVLHNQDGVHIQGIARFALIKDLVVKTYDDAIAFNADDVAQGPFLLTSGDMHDIIIENIQFDTTRKGIRLLSATSRMDRVFIRNLQGTTIDNVLEASAYTLGAGNFGSIDIDGVDVSRTGTPMVLNEYLSFNHKYDRVSVRNIKRVASINSRSTILFKAAYEADETIINGVTCFANATNTFSDILALSGAKSNTLLINNYHYEGGSTSINNAIELNGFTARTVKISNAVVDSARRAFYISFPTINRLVLENNTAFRVDTSLHLINTGNVDTMYLAGNVLKDVYGRAFIVNITNVAQVKAYSPITTTLGSTATSEPIKYTFANVNYTMSPVVTLQDVTSNTTATSNFIKITGQNNVKNGNGLEFSFDPVSSTGLFQTYDRGGTNTLQKTLIQGTPVMLNNRIIAGANSTASDDGNTTFQIKGSFAVAIASTGTNLTLTAAHHTVKLTATGLTITLPSAASSFTDGHGRIYCIINPNGATSTVSTYNALAGGTSTTIAANSALWLQSNGTTWDQIK